MTAKQLHELTGKLIGQGRGEADVAVDLATFVEHEDATIHEIETAKYRLIRGVDDSGPVGPKCPMLVLAGGFKE